MAFLCVLFVLSLFLLFLNYVDVRGYVQASAGPAEAERSALPRAGVTAAVSLLTSGLQLKSGLHI